MICKTFQRATFSHSEKYNNFRCQLKLLSKYVSKYIPVERFQAKQKLVWYLLMAFLLQYAKKNLIFSSHLTLSTSTDRLFNTQDLICHKTNHFSIAMKKEGQIVEISILKKIINSKTDAPAFHFPTSIRFFFGMDECKHFPNHCCTFSTYLKI